jgi:hypothetical protein
MQDAPRPRLRKRRIVRAARNQVFQLLERMRSGCGLTLAEYVYAEDLLETLSPWKGMGPLGPTEESGTQASGERAVR